MTSYGRRLRERRQLFACGSFIVAILTVAAIIAMLPTLSIGLALASVYLAFCASTQRR
jgi:hypothetical protein